VTGIVILCSGQGAQAAGMFDTIADAPEAAPVFAAAARALDGCDPRVVVQQAAAHDLHRNAVAQVLCCTQAMAWWAVLRPLVPGPVTVAGYSAGEVAAWGVAGVIDAAAVLDLAAQRAALMDAATHAPSGVAAVLGLPRTEIDAICRAHDVGVAIVNGPQHYILGGTIAGLTEALTQAERRGAVRSMLLPVGVASHTALLRQASEQFGVVLGQRVTAARLSPCVRLISGVDGAPVLRIEDGLRKLALQISQTVDWAACMDACIARRPQRVLELGPGDALARMIGEAAPGISARSVTAFRSITGVRRWLAAI